MYIFFARKEEKRKKKKKGKWKSNCKFWEYYRVNPWLSHYFQSFYPRNRKKTKMLFLWKILSQLWSYFSSKADIANDKCSSQFCRKAFCSWLPLAAHSLSPDHMQIVTNPKIRFCPQKVISYSMGTSGVSTESDWLWMALFLLSLPSDQLWRTHLGTLRLNLTILALRICCFSCPLGG